MTIRHQRLSLTVAVVIPFSLAPLSPYSGYSTLRQVRSSPSTFHVQPSEVLPDWTDSCRLTCKGGPSRAHDAKSISQ
ncbi:hypothetical protein RRG08_014052 [Elysia crispata]|uniref:Secreted protein n=1 Tax=Elysia crispata TaxID=231223 RepID=A0AAE1DQE9_9GAST|nr:hypothetical protein RRG08_014052 [Elysia crispata]